MGYAFATYVIWGQFAAVENEILKESGALKDLILFLAHFVLTDLDNPFEGTWNASSQPFADLATKYR